MLFLVINQYLYISWAHQFYHAQVGEVFFPSSELQVTWLFR